MIHEIAESDYLLFRLINGFNDPVLDFAMKWASDKWIWIPFYVWLLYIIISQYGKKTIYIIIAAVLMITISDRFSVLIKNAVHRLRPCHDPGLLDVIHLVNNECGGNYGFVSSHAANSMALMVFMIILLPAAMKITKAEVAAYTLLVGYSRIYLGAHFPGDVMGGWLLGAGIGAGTGLLINSYFKRSRKIIQQ